MTSRASSTSRHLRTVRRAFASISRWLAAERSAQNPDACRFSYFSRAWSPPVSAGWLFKLQLTNPAEFDDLLSEEAYKALLDE